MSRSSTEFTQRTIPRQRSPLPGVMGSLQTGTSPNPRLDKLSVPLELPSTAPGDRIVLTSMTVSIPGYLIFYNAQEPSQKGKWAFMTCNLISNTGAILDLPFSLSIGSDELDSTVPFTAFPAPIMTLRQFSPPLVLYPGTSLSLEMTLASELPPSGPGRFIQYYWRDGEGYYPRQQIDLNGYYTREGQ